MDVLTSPTKEPAAMTTQTIEVDEIHPDPFAGQGLRLDVAQSINTIQLANEIQRHTKRQDIQVIGSMAPGQREISAQHPGVLFISPGDLNAKMLTDLIAVHVAQPFAPVARAVPEQVEAVHATSAPSVAVSVSPVEHPLVDGLLTRLRAGEDLSGAETSDVLRALLGYSPVYRVAAPAPTPEPEHTPSSQPLPAVPAPEVAPEPEEAQEPTQEPEEDKPADKPAAKKTASTRKR